MLFAAAAVVVVAFTLYLQQFFHSLIYGSDFQLPLYSIRESCPTPIDLDECYNQLVATSISIKYMGNTGLVYSTQLGRCKAHYADLIMSVYILQPCPIDVNALLQRHNNSTSMRGVGLMSV
ncbi:hypothetical protein UY3_02524 [Chelonia mydas]|uniref:Uncharacterized protein n=1 Tax=Chelonia mydas TaxID=8469 RepID=M7CH33_CHEMY|nr:hypothetical protein UY3_02524 [Chelonia mydas]